MTPQLQSKLKRIRDYTDAASKGPWLECEDYDYYQGGTYLGTEPYHFKDGKKINGPSEDGVIDFFENKICRIEGNSGYDQEFIQKSRTDLPHLLEALELALGALQIYAGMRTDNYLSCGDGVPAREALSRVEKLLGEGK